MIYEAIRLPVRMMQSLRLVGSTREGVRLDKISTVCMRRER